ncbi:hypothetical protein [Aurantiacibacter marinus]|uniref:Uncharacterized protein n=1 Tax=Aurantiacibacter marinus TaxID=874156 RepID=A0A0H0XT54_9SPHN|nr:hypothetical protein [Aurantiacibacter marinus]KLI63460.1 hypothetical protein AAV99_06680 [Aurantiacibacter marinus]
MAEQLTREQIARTADIRIAPPALVRRTIVDRTFELPKGLYVATVGLYLGFIALMGLSFSHPEMIIPVAIFTVFVVGAFGLPTVWTRLAPETPSKSKSWARFRQEGIMTAYGRTSARDATVQVLILPVLIFVWGVVAVTIAALV